MLRHLLLPFSLLLTCSATCQSQVPPTLLSQQTNRFLPSDKLPDDFLPSPYVEFFGNYETAGVVLDTSKTLRDLSIVSRFSCDLNVDGSWSPVHDLVRVGDTSHFATSLFWLQPAGTYQVRIRSFDNNGEVGSVWFGSGTTRPEPSLPAARSVLWVSPAGDDTHPGTQSRPLRTIGRALQLARAGDVVTVRGGTYFEGQLEFANSGTVNAPVVLRSAPGETVILDGTDESVSNPESWNQVTPATWSVADSARTHHACVEDRRSGQVTRLYPVSTLQELEGRTLRSGDSASPAIAFEKNGIDAAMFSANDRLDISLSRSIGNYRIHVSGQNRGLILTRRNHIRLDGLQFQHYGRGEYTTAIFISDSSDIEILNCRFQFNNSYVSLKGKSDRITIQDCSFRDVIADWPFGAMKSEGGISGYFEGGAVNVDASYSGRGLVFRRNRISGLFDGAHLTPWRIDNARTNETDFCQNVVEDCVDDFLEADGFSRNVRIFDNTMTRSLSGVSLAQALDGPTFVLYNVLAECGSVPAAQREENYGYPFKTNGGHGSEIGSGQIFFYHNTAWTSDPDSRALLVKQAVWQKLTMRNNIWCGQAAGFELWPSSPSPIDWDYDNLFVADKSVPLLVQAYRIKYRLLPEITEQFGWQRHGLNADAGFQNAKQGSFELNRSSPCIDAGVHLPGINSLRAKGHAPDMGARESEQR